jgi:hypothetical protein
LEELGPSLKRYESFNEEILERMRTIWSSKFELSNYELLAKKKKET